MFAGRCCVSADVHDHQPGGGGANGINASGQVVGTFGATGAGFWTPTSPNGTSGITTDLGTVPGGLNSVANSINASGQIVGTLNTANGAGRQAFLYGEGVLTGIGPLPSYLNINPSYAEAINASGEVVGYVTEYGTAAQGYMWSGGVMTSLGTLPGGFSPTSAQWDQR